MAARKTLDQLKAEYESAQQEARALSEKAYDAHAAHGFGAEYEAAREASYQAHLRLNRAHRALLRRHKEDAAKESPVFVTWKRYGFRHIVAIEQTSDADYHGEPYKRSYGWAFCGNHYSTAQDPTGKIWWMKDLHDARGTERPLCGTCKKNWERLSGAPID